MTEDTKKKTWEQVILQYVEDAEKSLEKIKQLPPHAKGVIPREVVFNSPPLIQALMIRIGGMPEFYDFKAMDTLFYVMEPEHYSAFYQAYEELKSERADELEKLVRKDFIEWAFNPIKYILMLCNSNQVVFKMADGNPIFTGEKRDLLRKN